MKIWNKIKSYGKWIIGGIIGLLALIATIGRLFTKHTKKNIQRKIDNNNNKLQHVKYKEEQIVNRKRQVKKELTDLKETVKKTKSTKTSKRRPGRPKKTVSQAKHNIVSKTKRKK